MLPTIVFHVGMGKTGSTAIQTCLENSTSELAAAGWQYLGSWMDVVGQEFANFDGFQSFLVQTAEDLEVAAHRFVEAIRERHLRYGINKFIVSNEQYLENIGVLRGFFEILRESFEIEVLIYVRAPESWLPSAYLQWGVVHKTNLGPLQSFPVMGRHLMEQYRFVRQWRDVFPQGLTVLPFLADTDAAQSFADYIGVDLKLTNQRIQVRPSEAEAILRASFNNLFDELVHPNAYDGLYLDINRRGLPKSVSAKLRYIFDTDDLSDIIDENRDVIEYLEKEFGLSLSGGGRPYDHREADSRVFDELVGTIVDLLVNQAQKIRVLSSRIDHLERKRDQS